MKNIITIGFMLLISVQLSRAQINVVVADFKNESDVLFLDSWERSVPELLKAELTQDHELNLLERRKMDAIFEEQKLALAGFVNDSALVKQIGNLVGADIILNGSIYKIGRKFRIDVNITRVKTTRVITEIAEAPDRNHLKTMIDILANNIRYQLTGNQKYIEQRKIADYPTLYFLAATGGLAVAALVSQQAYTSNYDKYHEATELKKFDSYYNKANNAHKLAILFGGMGAVALGGTIYCWIGNMTGGAVKAHRQSQLDIRPGLLWLPGTEGRLSVQITF